MIKDIPLWYILYSSGSDKPMFRYSLIIQVKSGRYCNFLDLGIAWSPVCSKIQYLTADLAWPPIAFVVYIIMTLEGVCGCYLERIMVIMSHVMTTKTDGHQARSKQKLPSPEMCARIYPRQVIILKCRLARLVSHHSVGSDVVSTSDSCG